MESENIVIHEEVVARVKEKMPQEEPIYEVSELFKDLSALLNMTQSAVSHQLRILRQARLVKSRKDGRVVYYSLDDDHIDEIFALAFTHIMEEREG